jgi:hypothetical protein
MKHLQILHENSSSYLHVLRVCFRHMTSMCKIYECMKNEFHTISILKLLNEKFVKFMHIDFLNAILPCETLRSCKTQTLL